MEPQVPEERLLSSASVPPPHPCAPRSLPPPAAGPQSPRAPRSPSHPRPACRCFSASRRYSLIWTQTVSILALNCSSTTRLHFELTLTYCSLLSPLHCYMMAIIMNSESSENSPVPSPVVVDDRASPGPGPPSPAGPAACPRLALPVAGAPPPTGLLQTPSAQATGPKPLLSFSIANILSKSDSLKKHVPDAGNFSLPSLSLFPSSLLSPDLPRVCLWPPAPRRSPSLPFPVRAFRAPHRSSHLPVRPPLHA